MANPQLNQNSESEVVGPDVQSGTRSISNAVQNRQDDDRRRDEARTVALQNQVDELRQAMREVTTRQIRDEELAKQQETILAQTRLSIEQSRQEAQQSSQARALDENRTRQMVQDLEARIDDGTRPIRSLQAHVTELLDTSRRKVDDSSQNQQRFDELVTMIEHLSSLGDRTTAITHGLRDNIEGVRSEVDSLRRDVIRTDDSVKIVDQEARRRTSDVQDVAESYGSRLDELRADLAHLYDTLEDTRRGLVHVDPTLDELRAGELSLRQDITRLQSTVNERHDTLIDMYDDARQETDARFDQIRLNLEERSERLNERLDEANEAHRELTYRVSDLNGQLEELRQVDASLHRDIWYLHEQRVRVRLEQVQEELDIATSQRRDAESDAQSGLGGRFRRRTSNTDNVDH
jgi:chromosome segregation ATPase